jgi:hypothetical protein
MTTYFLAAVLASGMAVGVDSPPPAAGEALELAARNYRIQVYETFHSDRAEYDRRIALWNQLESQWRDAGEPSDEQFNLIFWLVGATTQSRPDAVGPLPEPPRFAARLPQQKPIPSTAQSPSALTPSSVPAAKTTPATTTGVTKAVGPLELNPTNSGPTAAQPAAPAKTPPGGSYLDKLRRSVNAARGLQQP